MPTLHIPGFGPAVVDQQVADDFLCERKRLREAREQWVEENEAPTAYSVAVTDSDGQQRAFRTPFQIGKIIDTREYSDAMKIPSIHNDPKAEKDLLDGIDAILAEANAAGPERLTVLVAGEETVGFKLGGDNDQSPYPAIEDGEDYGEYYARVSCALERAAGQTGSGRPVAGDDGLRQSAAIDSAGVGRPDALGEAIDREDRPMLDCDAEPVRSSDADQFSYWRDPTRAGDPDVAPTGAGDDD